jgi:hypothetical protein
VSWPVVLSASDALSEGELGQFDTERLQNVYDSVLAIKEVRVSMKSMDLAALSFTTQCDGGHTIRLKIAMDEFELMREFTPVALLGRNNSVRSDHSNLSSQIDSTKIVGYSHYTWKFRSPLYVPVGGVLHTQSFRTRDGLGSAWNVAVAYAGLVMPKSFVMPPRVHVPFAGSFVSTKSAVTGISTEKDLLNALSAPLRVSHMIGRVWVEDTAAEGFVNDLVSASHLVKLSEGGDEGTGRDLVKDYVPYQDVFASDRAAWWMRDLVLPPRSRYVLSFTGGASNRYLMASVIGDREESL